MWRLSRLILIYWLPSFQALYWILFLFITVVIYDLTYIFFLPFPVTDLCHVNSSSRIGRILLIFLLLLLFILSCLIKRIKILGKSRHRSLKSLRFIFSIAFYCFLGLDLVCGSVGWLTSLKTMLIGLSYIKTWS